MLQYVGQQHRERQGRGNENEAEECVRLCVGTSECMFSILGISGLSHFKPVVHGGCAACNMQNTCQIPSFTAGISAECDLNSQAEKKKPSEAQKLNESKLTQL